MARVGLEISDVGLMAAGGNPPALLKVDGDRAESPGMVLQSRKKLAVGWAAHRQARISPRQGSNRFWSMLSTEPLQERALSAPHYAELAMAHLRAVAETIPVPEPGWVMAVPEFLDQAKLGVLLAVARALDLSVEGFVSNAVAAARPVEAGWFIVHVDVHLHRVELTLLEQGDRIHRSRSHLITEGGWERLEDQIAHRIAGEFVQSTRFDPFHEAAAEQALYDQIPEVLRRVTDGQPIPLELKLGKSAYRITIPGHLVAEVCDPLCHRVVESLGQFRGDHRLEVQLSHRAARVPKLERTLGRIDGIRVSTLPPGAGALGALAMGQEWRTEDDAGGVNFLSSKASGMMPPPPPIPSRDTAPTHVLLGSQAIPIGPDPLWVVSAGGELDLRAGAEPEGGMAHGRIERAEDGIRLVPGEEGDLIVADEPVPGHRTLRTGDRIRAASAEGEIHLIHVRPADET